jgi:cytoskeletal protein CcmA (bactofilin family)
MRWLGSESLLGACLVVTAFAAARGADFSYGDDVTIKAEEIIDGDLYVFGKRVSIEGSIKGDLIAIGQEIYIKGPVEGDVAAAGQAIVVEGQLGDDARLAGQVLKLASTAQVKGDVLAAGQSMELQRGAKVDGDFVFAGYQADLGGDIEGKVKAVLANCRLAGAIKGEVNLEVGGSKGETIPPQAFGPPPPVAMPAVPGGLTITSTANVAGKLHYTASHQGEIDEEAELAEVEFSQQKAEQKADAPPPTLGQRALAKIRHFAAVGILGLAMVLLLPRWSAGLADTLREKPLQSLVGGVGGVIIFWVAMIALVVGVIVLAILLATLTLGELSLAVVVLGLISGIALAGLFWLFAYYLAPAVVSLMIGRLIAASTGSTRVVVPFLIGFVIVAALLSIPFVEGIVGWLIFLAGLGALSIWLFFPRPTTATLPSDYPPAKPLPA